MLAIIDGGKYRWWDVLACAALIIRTREPPKPADAHTHTHTRTHRHTQTHTHTHTHTCTCTCRNDKHSAVQALVAYIAQPF